MGGTERNPKKPGPSYEDGELRDDAKRPIEDFDDTRVSKQHLLALVRKAVGKNKAPD